MSERKRITIHDVARECGLALSTVSNALSGKPHVSAETRQTVRAVADRLGYRASTVARALRMQRSSTIGVLMADVANPSFPDFVRGIEDVVVREQCTLLLCNTDGVEAKQISHMKALLDRQVDGIVLISQHCASPEVRELLDNGPPFVLIQRRSLEHEDDYVGSDNRTGITSAVQHLVELGHRRIGFVHGPVESTTALERLATYRDAVARFGLDQDPDLIVAGDYNTESGYHAAMRMLRAERRPTAILASNDLNAMGVMEAAHELNLSIPRNVSVVGFDDIALASFRRIDLTTIHLPKRDMGAAAAELLMKRIHAKRRTTAREIIFPTRLIPRGSTAEARIPAAAAIP